MGQWETHIRIISIGIILIVTFASALLIFSAVAVDSQDGRETIRDIPTSRTSIFSMRESVKNLGVDSDNGRIVLFLTSRFGMTISGDDEAQSSFDDLRPELSPTEGETLSYSGDLVAWRTWYSGSGFRVPMVVVLNISDPDNLVYRTNSSLNPIDSNPVIWDGYIFWAQGTEFIMVHDYKANKTSQCKTNTVVNSIAINDGVLLWSGINERSEVGNVYWSPVKEIIGYDTNYGERLLVSQEDQHSPAKSGDNYIWIETHEEEATDDDGDTSAQNKEHVLLFDNYSTDAKKISQDSLSPKNPTIKGNLTAWDEWNPDADGLHQVMIYNLSSKQLMRLRSENRDRHHPVFFGSELMWLEKRDGRTMLYSLDMDELRPRIKVVPGFDLSLALLGSLTIVFQFMVAKKRKRLCPPAETPCFIGCTRHTQAADPAGGSFVRYRGCPRSHSRPR